jgi:hypothetical protein
MDLEVLKYKLLCKKALYLYGSLLLTDANGVSMDDWIDLLFIHKDWSAIHQ